MMSDNDGSQAVPARNSREFRAKGSWMSFTSRLRAYLLAGILVTAPLGITLYLAWVFLSFIDSRVTPLIPSAYNPNNYLPFGIPGLGLIIVIAFLILVGATTAGLVGRLLILASERVLARMPFIRGIYGASKQIVETLFSHKSTAFRQVVLVEWPRRGMWSMGFITGPTQGEVRRLTDRDLINVLLLTTPNPTSGFLMFVPKEELHFLNMTADEAMKMLISGGIVTPPDLEAAQPPELEPLTPTART